MAHEPATSQDANDAADPRQHEPRRGFPGKGFDGGTGYGGGGNTSLYNAESSYGGQSGIGGDTMRGAYAGEQYRRQTEGQERERPGSDPHPDSPPDAARDTDGRGSANEGEGPADPNLEAVTEAFEAPDPVDLTDAGESRRDAGR